MTRVTDRTSPNPSDRAAARRRAAANRAADSRGVRQPDMTGEMIRDAGIEPAAQLAVDQIARDARLTGSQVLGMLQVARTLADSREGRDHEQVIRAVDVRNAWDARGA